MTTPEQASLTVTSNDFTQLISVEIKHPELPNRRLVIELDPAEAQAVGTAMIDAACAALIAGILTNKETKH
jgi:hypothetical protein